MLWKDQLIFLAFLISKGTQESCPKAMCAMPLPKNCWGFCGWNPRANVDGKAPLPTWWSLFILFILKVYWSTTRAFRSRSAFSRLCSLACCKWRFLPIPLQLCSEHVKERAWGDITSLNDRCCCSLKIPRYARCLTRLSLNMSKNESSTKKHTNRIWQLIPLKRISF